MFKAPSNYFLAICFDWKDIFKVLDVSEEDQKDLVINEKYHYQSPNANSTDGRGINRLSAIFEYYIIPNSIRNGKYRPYSSIFDQQLKRFFETPNINYGPVLENKKNEVSLTCLFCSNSIKGKAEFSIYLSNNGKWKTVVFLFDERYLNLKDAHTKWGDEISFESFEVSNDIDKGNAVRPLSLDSNTLRIITNVQSQDDAGAAPYVRELNGYLSEKKKWEDLMLKGVRSIG